MAERLDDLPRLAGALSRGEVTFDKVRAVVDSATPETDEELCDAARSCSVRELAALARAEKERSPKPDAGRNNRTLRCNDSHRTITAQFTPENYAEVKTLLVNTAKQMEFDRDTRWDQRLHDALLLLMRNAVGGGSRSPDGVQGAPTSFFVVAHVPLSTLISENGDVSDLAGELEAGGYLHRDVVRRLACDSRFAVAIDDDVGRTMFEGRARRWATAVQRREVMRRDRHCRFPGCINATFTNVHHVTLWSAGGSTTSRTSRCCVNTIITWSTLRDGPCPGTRTRSCDSSARTVTSQRRDRPASGPPSRHSGAGPRSDRKRPAGSGPVRSSILTASLQG